MNYISRYEPNKLLNEVNRIIERAFNSKDLDTSNIETSQWVPAVDVKEDKNQFQIIVDLPGVEKKDVSISMENNVLGIKGSREEVSKEESNNYYRVERSSGTFYRQFTLPETADGSKIGAKLKNGVLEITIPKKESVQPKLIDIESD